ncbi:glyoxalase [Actinoplanes sp. L3-i22]|uniref:glyoxalase n=1 Tax=Actinoplanes sp. L3-i22 TaxID=2836373 RepID=UPI001C8549F1|nr:glyoxalase [Actinoplanes sp. L3-i22]
MTTINSISVGASDPAAAAAFYQAAFDLGDIVRVHRSEAPTTGFRGFAVSLVVAQPADVDMFAEAALGAGATALKPVTKSFWGYGGVVQAPDGTIWKLATSSKKNTAPATRRVEAVVLLLGVENVKATKQFYLEHGMTVAKSFGSKYVEFTAGDSPMKLALYTRRAAAKDVGTAAEGTGSHRISINGDNGSFTDPDGFVWGETTAHAA